MNISWVNISFSGGIDVQALVFCEGQEIEAPSWEPAGQVWGGVGWDGMGMGLTLFSRDVQWQKPLSTSHAGAEDACGFYVAQEFVDCAL